MSAKMMNSSMRCIIDEKGVTYYDQNKILQEKILLR